MINKKLIKSSLKKIYAIEKRFEIIEEKAGLPDFLPREQGYKALQKTIVGQQLSIASASAIWNRFLESGFAEDQNLSLARDNELRAIGLSRQKILYLKSLADSDIKYEELDKISNENIIKLLTSIKGIGQWTAEIYLIFSLKREDIFPAGDLALQEATRLLLKLNTRPNEKEMRSLSEQWKPFRSICALFLWHFYKNYKSREVILW